MKKQSGKKNILAIHRYFWPDVPPYAILLRAIASRWVQDGHVVEVLSTQPSYKPQANLPSSPNREVVDGIKIKRLPLLKNEKNIVKRMMNIALFSLNCFFRILFSQRYDYVMASTVPQVVLGFLCCLSCRMRGIKFIYHCMDIHPEIGRISGEFSNRLFFKILQCMDSWTCNHAYRVIVLSTDMKKSIELRPTPNKIQIEIINNFDLPSFDSESMPSPYPAHSRKEGTFRMIFAGNVGRFQNLDKIIDAMKLLKDPSGMELIFVGDGKAKDELMERAGELLNHHIFFIPHQPLSVARTLIRHSDIGLISLRQEIIQYAYPSKTMTYLSEGCPIFAIVEKDSELACFIERENIGIACPPYSCYEIANILNNLVGNKKYNFFKNNSLEKGRTLFNIDRILDCWSQLVM